MVSHTSFRSKAGSSELGWSIQRAKMPVRSCIQRGRPGALEKASTLAPERGKKGAKVGFEEAATSRRFSISCFSMRTTGSSSGCQEGTPSVNWRRTPAYSS
jgi:hypothetical protein